MAKAENRKWTRICIRCGKKMKGVTSNKRLCNSCIRIRQQEHDRAKAKACKLEAVERATQKKKSPEDSFESDIREADRLGMSYGKYKAWKEGRIHIHG